MKVHIVRPGESPAERADVAIVVDVLRATTTAAVLCHRLGELCVVRAPDDLRHLPTTQRGYTLFSELKDVVTDLPRFDNSPTLARDADLAGRTPVLVTTNGTIAIGLAAQLAREIVLAGFVNLAAVAEYVQRFTTIAVMPAGNINKAQRTIEDDGCADALVARLTARAFDIAGVIAACRVDERIARRRANEPGLAADINVCLDLDSVPVVPCVSGSTEQGWFRVHLLR